MCSENRRNNTHQKRIIAFAYKRQNNNGQIKTIKIDWDNSGMSFKIDGCISQLTPQKRCMTNDPKTQLLQTTDLIPFLCEFARVGSAALQDREFSFDSYFSSFGDHPGKVLEAVAEGAKRQAPMLQTRIKSLFPFCRLTTH